MKRTVQKPDRFKGRRETLLSLSPKGGVGRGGHRLSSVPPRHGITLFEVLVALAVFLGAFAVIGQIISTGSRASVTGQLESEAVLRAQTKLAEVVAGIEPMSGVEAQAFEDDPDWSWSLTVSGGPHEDLLLLTVTIEHLRSDGTPDATFPLTRLVRDPQLFLDAASAAVAEEE